ncbi:MAG: diacylglycerol O-acyltransferase / wax synthase, partial [Acidimicrobiaceae bacterium]|nr:diacylglycerol O-acyltransferase / wax synthase [Acidimicrobiaceae bacterium]
TPDPPDPTTQSPTDPADPADLDRTNPPTDPTEPGRPLLPAAVQQLARTTRLAATTAAASVLHPMSTVETGRSLFRQAFITESSRSPLWTGRRGLARHFEILSFDLDQAKRAAHALGGSLNDIYTAGLAGGVGAYHQALGFEVEELRMSMAVSTRQDKSAGGNAFAPARLLVPTGAKDPRQRFEAVRERLAEARSERSLGVADALAGVLTTLPAPLLVRMARQQVQTVDFATSNVRGAPFDLYVAGARILANHPFGPTGGTALNATVLSYKGSMDVGLNCDTAAITEPVRLRRCIEDAFNELLHLAG